MDNKDYCQVYVRGFSEEIEKVISFIETANAQIVYKDYYSADVCKLGYNKKEIGDELYELEVMKPSLAPQIIEQFPLLKVTGLYEGWDDQIVRCFHSPSGTINVTSSFGGYFDRRNGDDDSRWAWCCNLFDSFEGEFLNIQTGLKTKYKFTYPYYKEWLGATYFREVNGTISSVQAPYKKEFVNDFIIKNKVLEEYIGSDSDVVIPDGVTRIKDNVFYRCTSIEKVTIPDSVTSIGNGAFSDCSSLTTVTIPDSVTSIGNGAFFDCSSLTNITIPDSVTTIGDNAFCYCECLKAVYITDMDAWRNINFGNWYSNPLSNDAAKLYLNDNLVTNFVIRDGETSISNYAFGSCTSLTSITIPDSVTSIGNSAFYNCSQLTSITIPDSVTSIGNAAFSDCSSLTSVTIPDSVTSIGNGAFSDCSSLTSVTIPDSVTSIGNGAFSGCTNITSVDFPKNLKTIEKEAFLDCGLKEIFLPNDVICVEANAFVRCSATKIVITGKNVTIRKNSFKYTDYLSEMVIPSVTPKTHFSSALQPVAAASYLLHTDLYEKDYIVAEYNEIIENQLKKIVKHSILHDLRPALEKLVSLGYITLEDLAKDFLKSAKTKNATECVKFLTEC